MGRASYLAGDWAINPHLHVDLGNYWTMRSRTRGQGDPKAEANWLRAVWNYRKAMQLDGTRQMREEIETYVRNFYPDESHLKKALPK